jgi:hypothetical protein
MRWEKERSVALDEIEAARLAVGSGDPRRRAAAQQLNQAYLLLLSSQFQGFCRDLHSEAILHVADHVTPAPMKDLVREQLLAGRVLDRGNPTPGNLGSDFARFGLELWPTLLSRGKRNLRRRDLLSEMSAWRNAIAHQDFDSPALGGRSTVTIESVRRWRAACNGLVVELEAVLGHHLVSLVQVSAWQ